MTLEKVQFNGSNDCLMRVILVVYCTNFQIKSGDILKVKLVHNMGHM